MVQRGNPQRKVTFLEYESDDDIIFPLLLSPTVPPWYASGSTKSDPEGHNYSPEGSGSVLYLPIPTAYLPVRQKLYAFHIPPHMHRVPNSAWGMLLNIQGNLY